MPEIHCACCRDVKQPRKHVDLTVNLSNVQHILGSVQKEGEAFGSSSEGGCSVEVPLTVMVEYR